MSDLYPAVYLVAVGALAIICAMLLGYLGLGWAQWLGWAGLAAFIGGVLMAAFEGVDW